MRDQDDLSTLDQKLYQAKVYGPLDKKRLQVWVQIRNYAAHGHFDRYDDSLVRETLSGVQEFLAQHLR